jgi:sugar/nucleoside kinase (ribokinase family)
VITIADMSADLMIWGEDLEPDFGQKEKILDGYVLDMGGSCAIFACQCAKLALKTSVIGTVGHDVIGKLIVDRLEESGVDVSHVIWRDDVTSSLGVAMCRENTRAIFSCVEGLDATEYEQIPTVYLESTRHIHIGSYFLLKKMQPFFPEIIKIVQSAGGTVSLDTNWDPSERWDDGVLDILPKVDLFLPNENELCAIMREEDVETALRKASKIVGLCVVKCGRDGAMCLVGDKLIHFKTDDVPVKDTVGAGDSFDAGFLYGWLNGYAVEKCGHIGTLCAMGNILASGGINGQPRIDQIRAALMDY